MDEKEPEPAQDAEKPTIPAEKPPEPDKKARRRSSIGGDILNAFMNSQNVETMSPVEPRTARPRRAVQLRPVVVQPTVPVVPRKKPVRYSFDLGVRVETKSCLKPSTAPILIRKGPKTKLKSLTQRTAQKVLTKYRKSRSMTPGGERESKLRFDQICTIRVITPRPEYDPDNLEMPHSDDEDAQKKANPDRQRLSTVQLRLTPTSEAQLGDLQNQEVVQFRAQMVFGDDDDSILSPTEHPSTSTINSILADALVDAQGAMKTMEIMKAEDSEVPKKKKSRRKSLIVGAASPLKIQSIERPRFEDFEEEISEPKRKTRRSIRLNPSEIIGNTEEIEEDDLEKLHEEPVILDEAPPLSESEKLSKKRELDSEVAVTSSEPAPKRNRRKSGFVERESEEKVEKPEIERKNRRKTRVLKKEIEEESEKSDEKPTISDFFSSKPRKTAEKSKKRRSTRFVVTEIEESEVLVTSEAPTAPESIPTSTKDSEGPEASKDSESTPKPAKLASIFMKTPNNLVSSAQKLMEKIEKSEEVFKKSKGLEDAKFEEPLPATPATPKLFGIFAAKPKTPRPVETPLGPPRIIDLTQNSPKINISTPSSTSRIPGIRREATWGDAHPETYQFIQNVPLETSIFPESEDSEDSERILKFRRPEEMHVDSEVEDYLKMRRDSEKDSGAVILTSSGAEETIQKLEIPECDPLIVYPSTMDELIEGAEEERTIRGWMRKWKRKVRKDAENEQKKGKKKEKKRKRRRNGEEDEDSEDEDYEEESMDLENPLVLIGPTGVGKSALIRALAKQENMHRLAIGPDSLRTGREIKERLQEAMKSHRVDQQPARRMSFFYGTGQKEYPTTDKTAADKDYTQTLIVIEHVDVFFESIDRNGISGLLEMVNEARVPVVFTCEKRWPKRWGNVELERRPLEIWMRRDERKVRQYVQQLIYSTRNVHIDSSTISSLSTSVNHDLRALINQANLYSLSPNQPLPLTSRHGISTGFSKNWDIFPKIELKMERIEDSARKYSEFLEEIPTCQLPLAMYPGIREFWDAEARGASARNDRYAEHVRNAAKALNGRFSKRAVAMDLLPMLAKMDRVEKRKASESRRHLHRFLEDSRDVPMDGESLIRDVAKWTKYML